MNQDAERRDEVLEVAAKAARAKTISAIRDGLADVAAGRTKPARTALKMLAKKHGIRDDL